MLSYEAWTDERTAVCHNKPYVDGHMKMNSPYPEITNISFLAKLFFKTFISLKHLSDYRTIGPSDCRTIGMSDYSYGPVQSNLFMFDIVCHLLNFSQNLLKFVHCLWIYNLM
jgi:hypothetical protein